MCNRQPTYRAWGPDIDPGGHRTEIRIAIDELIIHSKRGILYRITRFIP